MPVIKRGGKYFWGSKGPFDSREKAEAVGRAARAAGFKENSKITKDDMKRKIKGK